MKNRVFFLTLIIAFSLMSAKPLLKEYQLDEEVELSGTIFSGIYLSRREGSDKEYHNEALLLFLEEDIRIKELDEQVSKLEIANSSFFWLNDMETEDFYRKKVRIKGTLKLIDASGNGFHRQIFSPVSIEIISIEFLE